MEISALPRRDRERLARRAAMLEAAKAVFAEKGYEQATVDEIAERAEFGKGTLYNYFEGGKEGILFAILEAMFDEWAALVTGHFAAADPVGDTRETFRGLIAKTIAHFIERRDLFVILVKEVHRMALTDQADKVAYLAHHRERIVEAMVPPLAAAMEASRLQPIPPHGVAHLLMGNINGYLMFACAPKVEGCAPHAESPWLCPERAADFITAILFDGLLPRA